MWWLQLIKTLIKLIKKSLKKQLANFFLRNLAEDVGPISLLMIILLNQTCNLLSIAMYDMKSYTIFETCFKMLKR